MSGINEREVVPGPPASGASLPERPPYGVLASFGWLIVAEAAQRIFDFILDRTGLQAALDRNYLTHSLTILVSWSIYLLVFMAAVRLRRLALPEYLGWLRPRMHDVLLGAGIIIGLYAALGALLLLSGNYAGAVDDYRTTIAAGTSPWWFVLQAWPTLVLSPTIEESAFRGFLWRGLQFRFGSAGAFVVTTLAFVAAHYSYWLVDGGVNVGTVVQYMVSSCIFGALRWYSGGTIAPMIAHSLDNAGLKLTQMALSALAP
jgi:membrane protease YdiL (CAAX protease family)